MSDDPHATTTEPTPPPPTGSEFRLGRVLFIVLPLGLILAGAAAFYAYGGADWLAAVMAPPLAPVEGQVFYQGKPLPNAVVMTKPVQGNRMGGYGNADEEGRFTLSTDVEGTFQDGAYAGEHRVRVGMYGPSPGTAAPPPLLTPEKYASFETSGFRIVVKKPPERTVITLELEGDVPLEGGGPSGTAPQEESNSEGPAGGTNPAGADEAAAEKAP